MARRPAPSAKDKALLEEIRERFTYATDEWKAIREDACKDMRYVAGDPWDAKDRQKREDAGRPCLALDELSQYVNQLINDVRQNKRAIKVDPEGNGANDQTATFRANLIRQIEYRSHAQNAYTTTFENTVQRSYGFHRVTAKYVPGKSFEQELFIEPLVNPDLVTPDPDALRADSSDMQYCFVHESRSLADFKKEFPDATVTDFSSDLMRIAPQWIKENRIQIAEYWTVEKVTRTLLLLKPGPGGAPLAVYADELASMPSADMILKKRECEEPSVVQYLTNGVEILKTTPWPGKYIPIISCYGKILYLDEGSGSKRKILSMIRLARDPYMLYCYYRTCEAELVGMTPKTPYMAYEGQFSATQLVEVQKSLHEPVAALFAKATTEGTGQQILPLPVRPSYEPPIQALEIGAEAARRAIQAAIGASPLPTQAQRRNEKSGVALEHIDESEQRGSYHFVDHYDDAITHTGRVLDDLIPHYYDTAREVGIRKPDDTAEVVRINDPKAADPQTGEYPRTDKGDHEVTISTGPSMLSERQAAKDFAMQLAGNPEMFALIGDLVTKLAITGPIADELVERLTPPQFKKPTANGAPDPQQLQQQVAGMQAQLQQVQGIAQQMADELKSKKLELDSKERIAKADIDSKEKIADVESRRRAETAIAVAEISKRADVFLEERDRIGVQGQQQSAQAHEVGLTAMEQQHAIEMHDRQAALATQQQGADHLQEATLAQQAADQQAAAPGV